MSGFKANIFLISPRKHMLWVLIKCLIKVLLMSTHNMCICGEIRKILNTFGLKKASYQELCSSEELYSVLI